MTKTLWKRVSAFVMAFVLSMSVIGFTTVDAEAASKPTKITLTKKTASVKVGSKVKIKVKKATPNQSKYRKVTWTSSDKTIAKVSKYGNVLGVKPGTVTITATSTTNKKVKATCKVTVYQNKYIQKKPSTSGSMYVYNLPAKSSSYKFTADGQSYKLTNANIATFMRLFGTSKNSLINRWNAKKSISASIGQFNVKVTGTGTNRTLKVTSPAEYKGTYTARLYKNREGHDYMFAVKGTRTRNAWQKFYVDSSKNYFTYTATNQIGLKYTYKVRKDGKSSSYKIGNTVVYKYKKTAKYTVISIDKKEVAASNLKAYYYGKVTK